MKVLHSQAQIYENLPEHIVNEWFVCNFLFLDQRVEVPHRAVLEDNIDFLSIDETIKVSNDVLRIHYLHDLDLLHGFHAYAVRHLSDINDFDNVELVLYKLSARRFLRLVDDALGLLY